MSSSNSSDIAKGNKFLQKMLYVQHVDKKKDASSEISELSFKEYLLDELDIFSESDFSKYLTSPKQNLGILKSSLSDEITWVEVYSNPLPAMPALAITDVTIHAFVVFSTENKVNSKVTWWSLEKNGQYIVLQQSPDKYDVTYKLYDADENEHVERLGPVNKREYASGSVRALKTLFRTIWENNQIIDKYNLLSANCQNFANFIFLNAHFYRQTWSTRLSAVVDFFRPKSKKTLSGIDGIDINGKNKTNDTALHLALYGEKWETAEKILDKLGDDDVNATDSSGDTPLHLAAQLNCEIRLFSRILARTNLETVNKQNNYGKTALHYVILNESNEALTEMLKRTDVDVNIKDIEKYTTLHFASTWKDMPINLFKIILNKSNDINAQNIYGQSALHLAIYFKSKTLVNELLSDERVKVNIKNNEEDTTLHYASMWKDMPIHLFKIILNKSNDINAQNIYGQSALHRAILYESKTSVDELLSDERVNVNIKDNEEDTTLHFASTWKDMPINLFKIILNISNDINAQNIYGQSALHLAIFHQYKILVNELLRNEKVKVNIKDKKDHTTLHFASEWKDMPINLFNIILNKSDDINAQNIERHSALHLAILNKSETSVNELLSDEKVNINIKDNDENTTLHCASTWKDMPIDLFKIILNKSVNINAQNINGQSALHLAIFNQSETSVNELLRNEKVKVNIRDNEEDTALHYASMWKDMQIDLFKIILNELDDINAQNIYGRSALHLAIFFNSETSVNELLSDKRVNVNIKDYEENTTLHYASMWKDVPPHLFKIILNKSDDINAKNKNGLTARDVAISETAMKELDRSVNVDLEEHEQDTIPH